MVDTHAQFKEILETLNETKRTLLCCHLGPDADSVGANLATKEWLESKGKKVTILFLPIVEGTDFGFSLRESDDGTIYGSLRSRTDVDVSIIAKALGGGGHRPAAAFRFEQKTSMEEATEIVHQKIKEMYDEIKKPI